MLFVVAVCCTIARGVIHVAAKRRPRLDDYFVILATAALAAAWAVLLKTLDNLYLTEAINDHPSEVSITLDEIAGLLAVSKWSKIFVVMAWTSIFAIKGAFLCFFHVLIRQLSRRLNLLYWFTVFLCAAGWLTLSFIDWAICPYVGEKTSRFHNHPIYMHFNCVGLAIIS